MALEDIDNLNPNPVLGDWQITYHKQIHKGLKSLKMVLLSNNASTFKILGDQTVSGVKTFNSPPTLPATTPSSSTAAVSKWHVDAGAAAMENILSGGTAAQYYRGDKTWQTLNATAVGIANVANTADVAKPVSTAMQTALNLKQDLLPSTDGKEPSSLYYRGDKTWQTLDKTTVGLGNANNTSDESKPVSTATQTALNLKQNSLGTGETFNYLRGDKTWQVLNGASAGLGNVNNTTDLNKPISTATQTALNGKADIASTLALTGNQTIDGTKTFSSSPRLTSTSTSGYVWKATSTDGSGSWQVVGPVQTTVEWNNIANKPATFTPTVGSGANQAAPGNHTHTKSSVGLSSVDNTSDANKPISTATQAALDVKVATSRSVNTSSHFADMGNLSANRTLVLNNGGIGISDLSTAARRIQIAYIQTLDTRAVGTGQVPEGYICQEAMTITSVAYRMGTTDGSGTTTVELRKNGSTVSGTSGTASASPTAVTGSWSFAVGDILTVHITAVGTTPGKRLTADILALRS